MGSIKVCLKRKGKRGCGVKPVLGICLVEGKGISMGTVELFLVGRLSWLNSDVW